MRYKLYTVNNKFIKKVEILPDDFTGFVVLYGGSKHWYKNGKMHRDDGPAMEFMSGTKHWFQNDKIHRIGGPAIEHSTGGKEYFVDDKKITKQEHDLLVDILKLRIMGM